MIQQINEQCLNSEVKKDVEKFTFFKFHKNNKLTIFDKVINWSGPVMCLVMISSLLTFYMDAIRYDALRKDMIDSVIKSSEKNNMSDLKITRQNDKNIINGTLRSFSSLQKLSLEMENSYGSKTVKFKNLKIYNMNNWSNWMADQKEILSFKIISDIKSKDLYSIEIVLK